MSSRYFPRRVSYYERLSSDTYKTAYQNKLPPLEHQGRKLPNKIDSTLQPVFELKNNPEFTNGSIVSTPTLSCQIWRSW